MMPFWNLLPPRPVQACRILELIRLSADLLGSLAHNGTDGLAKSSNAANLTDALSPKGIDSQLA